MAIWHKTPDVAQANEICADSMVSHLGIEITGFTDESIKGRMVVDQRTHQPYGLLHGGASVAFAETLASLGAVLTLDQSKQYAVGMEINANHLRPVTEGYVYGEATPISLGRRSQVWDIRIASEDSKPVCISRCTMAVMDAPAQ